MARITALFILLLAFIAPAGAAETITRFESELTVNADSSVSVVETLAVTAEGDQIKRGIFRDFPTRYTDPQGHDYVVGFTVESVTRDGAPENFAVEEIANGVRIRIGKRDVFLQPGPYTYQIRYRATREIGFFEGYDEIYWNVTGNSWAFPIERAMAIIHVPPGARIVQHAAYTGMQGSNGRDFRVSAAEGDTYRAETTGRLAPGEGFTVAVGFTKGVLTPPVPPPPPVDTRPQSYVALAGGAGALLLYYLFAWILVGRDPKGSAFIPLFSAPPELGAAGVRYVWKRGFDAKTFACGAIALAAKGRFKIANLDKSYRVVKQADQGPALVPSERKMFEAHRGGTLEVTDKNHVAISAMRKALEQSLEAEYGRTTWLANRKWRMGGIPLSLAALAPAFSFMTPESFIQAFLAGVVFLVLWVFFLWLLWADVRAFFKPGLTRKIFTGIGFIILLALVLFLAAMMVAMVTGAKDQSVGIYTTGFAAVVAMHVLFSKLLTAPTILGRKLTDQIEGLRLYMTTAEEKRLDMLNPPVKTPELFEKMLPFALALDCENQWSEKFAGILAAASYAGPAWYAGNTAFNANDMGRFSSQLNSSQYDHTVSTSSSSSSPGSYSGSSGGGSSGGGGGGGGGGGW